MRLTDVMSTQIVSITPETRVGDAARRMIEAETGAAMVLAEGDDLVGVITERDLLRCVSEGVDPDTPASQRMTRHVLTGTPATELAEAMAMMVDGHFRHLPVVNEGQLVGVISIGDCVRAVIDEQQDTIQQLERFISG